MWMTRDLLTITSATPIREAALEMGRRHVRRLLVVERGARMRLVGIVALSDVARAYPPDLNPLSAAAERGPDEPVTTIMTRDPRTVAPDTPIEEAARLLAAHRIGALPVLQADRLVGIITESDVFRALVDLVGGGTPGVRITFDLGHDDGTPDAVLQVARRHGLRVVSLLSLDGDGGRYGVMKLTGPNPESVVDALWSSGRRVLSVLRTAPPEV